MRIFHIIIGVDGALDKITLLKELLYPADNFFRLISICKWTPPPLPRWYGLKFNHEDKEIILIDGKERFISDIHTEVTPDNYIEYFDEAFNFLEEQIRGAKSLDAQFYGAVPIKNNKIGERYLFREVHQFERIYIQHPHLKGRLQHQSLFPIFWIRIEELRYGYDVWLKFGSRLWFPNQEKYDKYFTPTEREENFERLYQYLRHFFENNLAYCRDVMLDPNENAENKEIVEFLKPIIWKMVRGKIKEIEILR